MVTKPTLQTRLIQVVAGTTAATVLTAGIAAACHPQGVILKDVQNLTTKSATVKADTNATALVAHPGDTLVYHISVANKATGRDDQMINTIITDALPAGLELVKQDSFNLGQINMKQTVERTITVKVTAKTAGVIKNQACFTGDSTDHKVPQKGCDLAYIKVEVPTPSPSPSVSPSPSPSASPSPSKTPLPTTAPSGQGEALGTATVLPETGAPVAMTTLGLGAMIAATTAYIKSRKRQ